MNAVYPFQISPSCKAIQSGPRPCQAPALNGWTFAASTARDAVGSAMARTGTATTRRKRRHCHGRSAIFNGSRGPTQPLLFRASAGAWLNFLRRLACSILTTNRGLAS